jgi:hypothetical protein
MTQLILLDKDLLRTAIVNNTDANADEAVHIISTVRAAQRKRHGGECLHDRSAQDVCEGMYVEKCDDVIGLCEALRAVLALAGESAEIRKIVADAIAEHGGVGEE